jgi:VWFA-related protein
MSTLVSSLFRFSGVALFCLSALLLTARAQQSQSRPEQETDDVIRISTDLVQTDVMVFDKEGRFVDGLKPEQFQLFIDGKQQTISFFERIAAGSASEEAQLAAARGQGTALEKATGIEPLDRGRVVLFFVDDLHMSPDSLIRARQTILQFIDREVRQNDQVAVTSATGQIGFLQQLTDNKTVLRRAAERLKISKQSERDMEFPPMMEVEALAIQVHNDQELLNYFMDPLVRSGVSPRVAENVVRGRAKGILNQSYHFTRNTLATLENLARTSGKMPGRKLIFFISDGFILNLSESDMLGRLRNITNAAARNGVVIYTLDSRGLVTGRLDDATSTPGFDPKGKSVRASINNISASQEPLQILAANTGGRALLNSNSPNAGFVKALQETSAYYLLAWRPISEEQRGNKFRRIEVKLVGQPDLSVYVRRGFYDLETKPPPKKKKAQDTTLAASDAAAPAAKTPEAELTEAIGSAYPLNDLPTHLSLVCIDVPDKGMVLTASMQMAKQFITFNHADGKPSASIDLAGVILDEQGKAVASFKDRVGINLLSQTDAALRRDLIYNFQTPLKPGLYQVRTAARDSKSKRMGSAMQWIEIPDLASRRLTLSSLLLSEMTKEAETMKGEPKPVTASAWSVDRRFARTSKLRFFTYIYNAARGAGGTTPPDIALQVQISRNDQPVMTTALRKLDFSNQADPARLAYAAEMPLETLPAGRYVLRITIIDRIAKTSASQYANYEIE